MGEIKAWGRDAILGQFRGTLERLRVPFDVWTHESTLYAGEGEHRGFAGEVGKALADLDGESLLYDEDGAVWLKTTRYGDDKDRVLIRSSGEPTYFLSDIAYHRDKMDRGFAHMIDIWGADHHGYVPRMKAAFTALPPHDPDRLELIIGQLVNLLRERRGQAHEQAQGRHRDRRRPRRRHRRGRGSLPARGTLTRHHPGARHRPRRAAVATRTRCTTCSTRTRASAASCGTSPATPPNRPARPCRPSPSGSTNARCCVTLARFPDVLLAAADQRTPHRVHAYLGELAAEFHVFYRHCRVLSDDADVTAFRAALCAATRDTLASGSGAARRERSRGDVKPDTRACALPAA